MYSERKFYDLTKEPQADMMPPVPINHDLPTHAIDIYELDGAVHIVIQRDEGCDTFR